MSGRLGRVVVDGGWRTWYGLWVLCGSSGGRHTVGGVGAGHESARVCARVHVWLIGGEARIYVLVVRFRACASMTWASLRCPLTRRWEAAGRRDGVRRCDMGGAGLVDDRGDRAAVLVLPCSSWRDVGAKWWSAKHVWSEASILTCQSTCWSGWSCLTLCHRLSAEDCCCVVGLAVVRSSPEHPRRCLGDRMAGLEVVELLVRYPCAHPSR